ncbi:MAG: hypothetical protein KF767_04495 [Bdellovibrionaceae bacterium]|nr:hypothetical protein [Pseudobdellovibrionaceae bacterium]
MTILRALLALLLFSSTPVFAANETSIFRCMEGLQGLLVPEDMNFRRIETPSGPQYLVQSPPRYVLFDGRGHRFVDTTKLDPAFRTEVKGIDGVTIPEIRLAFPGVRGERPLDDKAYQPLIVREGTIVENGKIMSWLSGDYGVDGKKWSLRMPKSEPLYKNVWMGKPAVGFRDQKHIVMDSVDPDVFDKSVKKSFYIGILDRMYNLAVEALDAPAPRARELSQKMQKAKAECAAYFEESVREGRTSSREMEELHFAMDKIVYSPNSGVKPVEAKKPATKESDGVQ